MVFSKILEASLVIGGATLAASYTPKIQDPTSITVLKKFSNSSLYAVAADGYSKPFYLLDLWEKDRKSAGFAYGSLLAEEAQTTVDLLFQAVLGNSTLEIDVVDAFLDWQYKSYLSQGTPDEYLEEMEGFAAGSASVGYPKNGDLQKRGLVLSSLAVGDVEFDVGNLLHEECEQSKLHSFCRNTTAARESLTEVARLLQQPHLRHACSHFGAWGSRTAKGALWTARNLDWLADSGIADYKLITIYHYPDAIAHAALGFAGLQGALAGISAQGITVHEAGDDNHLETLVGIPWTLRLRQVMEQAVDMESALNMWHDADNTLGINHGIGSSASNTYRALEVRANYSAIFADNDPREAALVGPDGTHYGFPVEEAVWRTNHGYDPTFLQTSAVQFPGTDSFTRYKLLHDTIVEYEKQGMLISELQAVNLTSIVGDKGGSTLPTFLTCTGPTVAKGENILSVAFRPSHTEDDGGSMLIAFEDGRGDQHVPACCGTYVRLDMTRWFR